MPPLDRLSRRTFLKASAAAAAAGPFINPRWARAGGSANEKLDIAVIGVWNRGRANINGVREENIVALCDVDGNYLAEAAKHFPNTRRYRDYRQMFDREADNIDAVVISTPDHHHAPAAARTLGLGKHVYCEKPLTHTVAEARTLARLAREKDLATQMGTQIHASSNYRRVVEIIRSGAIGPVREAHVWVGKSWSDGRKKPNPPAPAHLDWDLWLGPSKDQPYCEGVHPRNWRRYWEWGTGTLGDMACHYMDLVHWALDLRRPTRVRAEGPAIHPVGTPAWLIVHYDHPARGDMPACRVSWYDGGKRPDIFSELTRRDGSPVQWGDGHLFIGERGMLLSDYNQYKLLPEEDFAEFNPPPKTVPDSPGHHAEWIRACKTGSPTLCNFDYSGALTEAVLLGNIAFRAGEPLEWDGDAMRITNAPAARELLAKPYREGWELPT